jgi:hypothetical protein
MANTELLSSAEDTLAPVTERLRQSAVGISGEAATNRLCRTK